MDDATADIIRRAMLEEATNTGPAVNATAGPSVWHYPYWPRHDVAWEEER